MLSREEVSDLLTYDPDTGLLFWKYRQVDTIMNKRIRNIWNKTKAGKEAGNIFYPESGLPYVRITISRKCFFAHRLAWLLMKDGEVPDAIDHINGNSLDNRWANLRDGRIINDRNRKLSKRNTTGYNGVYWDKGKRKWFSSGSYMEDGRQRTVHLGYFEDVDDAAKAARDFRLRLGYDSNHGLR